MSAEGPFSALFHVVLLVVPSLVSGFPGGNDRHGMIGTVCAAFCCAWQALPS